MEREAGECCRDRLEVSELMVRVPYRGGLGLTLVICLQCPGGTFTPSMKSTKDYPDEVINFMRSHPLMYQAVYPLQRRPLVVRTGAPYRLTTVAVDQVDAADGRYEVLFLGTGTHCCSQTLPHRAHCMGGTDPGARSCPARGCYRLIYGNHLSLARIAKTRNGKAPSPFPFQGPQESRDTRHLGALVGLKENLG